MDPLQNTVGATASGAGTGFMLGGPVGGLIGGGLGLLSTIPTWMTANDQEKQGNELLNQKRPIYEIPQAEKDALATAQGLASQTRLPGQSAIEGRLDQTTANKVSMLERMGMGGADMINGASRAYGQQMDSENQLGIAAAQNYNANQHNLIGEQHTMAGYQDQQFQYNKADPYAEDIAYGRSLKGAGIQNKNTFWQNLLGTGANMAKGIDWKGMFNGDGGGADNGNNPYAGNTNWMNFSNSVSDSTPPQNNLLDLAGSGNTLIG